MPSPVTLKIKFKSASLQQFIERYSVDISKGGIFIRTPKPLSVGTTLKFEFHLSDGGSLLSGDGTVVWVREPDSTKESVSPGMGLRFDELPAKSQKVLEQILAQKKKPAGVDEQSPAADPEDDAGASALSSQDEADKEKSEDDAIEPADPPVDGPEDEDKDKDKDAPPDETEEERNKRLSQIVLSGEDEATPVGSTPLDDGPETVPHDALSVSPQPQEETSSGMIWLVILLLLGGAGFLYYKFVHQQTPPSMPPAVAMDMEVTQEPDMEVPPPEPTGVKMNLESTPPGARIIVDGEDSGKVTPAELEGLDPEKEIKIDFDLTGKKLVSKVLKPTPDQPLSVKLNQVAARKITFTSEPKGAVVIVNNLSMGKTPTRLKRRYRPGRVYKVEFKLVGHEIFRTLITGTPTWTRNGVDEALLVHAVMEKKSAIETPTPTPVPKAKARPKVRPRVRPRVRPKVVPKPKAAPKAEPKPAAVPKVEPKPVAKPKATATVTKPKAAVKKPKAAVKKPKWADEK